MNDDDDEFDDFGLPDYGPKDMPNGELADKLAALARRQHHALDGADRLLIEEVENRLRVQGHLKDAHLARVQEVQRLEAELDRLRGGPPLDDVVAVGRWRMQNGV